MKKIKIVFCVLIVTLCVANFSYAESVTQNNIDAEDASRELWNAVRYDETGNNLIIELDVIKSSLEKGADPNWRHEKYKNRISTLSHYMFSIPVHELKYADGLTAVKLLFKYGAQLNNNDGGILYSPIAWGRYALVKLLLENGADPNIFPHSANIGSDITPLELATEGNFSDIEELLISYGAEPLAETKLAVLKFIGAAKEGNIELMNSIISKYGKYVVDDYDRGKRTALISVLDTYFFEQGTWDAVKFLLDNGSNPNKDAYIDDFSYYTKPLHVAIHRTNLLINKIPEDIKNARYKYSPKICKIILQELLDKGAYVSGKDENGRTPLHVAAKVNNLVGAKMLIDAGSKIMPKDNDGKTPLDYAESAEMIKLLKKYGAKEF